MKKRFIAPEIAVCSFNTEDVITDSTVTAIDSVKSQLDSAVEKTYTAEWDIMK